MDRSIILSEWSDVEIYVHLGAEAAAQRCPRKRCSENMQLATALQLHWNRTSALVFFCRFAAYSPVYSRKMFTGKSNRNITYRLELLIPSSNTMLKLLVILFVTKLYTEINIFWEHLFYRSTSGAGELLLYVPDFLISSKLVILDKPLYHELLKLIFL